MGGDGDRADGVDGPDGELPCEEEGLADREETVICRDGREVAPIDVRPLPKEEALPIAGRSADRDHLHVTRAAQSIEERDAGDGWEAVVSSRTSLRYADGLLHPHPLVR